MLFELVGYRGTVSRHSVSLGAKLKEKRDSFQEQVKLLETKRVLRNGKLYLRRHLQMYVFNRVTKANVRKIR